MGLLNPKKEQILEDLKKEIFDNIVPDLLYHKYNIKPVQNYNDLVNLETKFKTKGQEAHNLWMKKISPGPQVGAKKIGFDFDGVIHTDVSFPDPNGVRHPRNHNNPNPNPFFKMHNIIKDEYMKGNEIFVITSRHQHSHSLIRNYLNKYGMNFILDDHIIMLNNTPKSNALERYKIQVFYDDSPNYIKNIINNINILPNLETLYLVYPERHNTNNFIEQKIVNHKVINVQSPVGANTISILSYNISWEAMTANDGINHGYNAQFCKKNGWKPNQKWENNKCFDNVNNYIKNKNADIIALQEATYWNKMKWDDKYRSLSYKSGSEDMVTLFNSNKLQFINKIEGDFSSGGRPYQIIEFEHKISKKRIIFVNVHCGHNEMKCISRNSKFQYNLNTIIGGRDSNSLHIIIAGDHNDTYGLGGPIVNGIKFHRDTSRTHTCCDSSGNATNHGAGKYDWILYNKESIQSNVDKIKIASDHLPVYGEISV